MRSDLPRIHPGRKLTEAQWEELRLEVGTDADHTVRELCERRGVSVARFYKRFPKGQRPAAKAGAGKGRDSRGGKGRA